MASRSRRLAKARKTQQAAARILHDVETGRVHITDVLSDPHSSLGPVRVFTLLCKVPHMGETGVKRVLTKANVWPMVRMRELSEDDRVQILNHLPVRAKKRGAME